MTDLVDRLHGYIAANAPNEGLDVLLAEAADEIERLERAYYQLRETYLADVHKKVEERAVNKIQK
jgi:hypothetical protein